MNAVKLKNPLYTSNKIVHILIAAVYNRDRSFDQFFQPMNRVFHAKFFAVEMSGLEAGFIETKLSGVLKVLGNFPVDHFERDQKVDVVFLDGLNDLTRTGEEMSAKCGFPDNGVFIADDAQGFIAKILQGIKDFSATNAPE